MRVLRWAGIAIGGLVVLIAAVAFGARFADGPMAIFPGGAFRSGEFVEAPADWAFAADIAEIELESGTPPRSRTVWILVEGGEAYVPCSLSFPPGKRWHKAALTDPAAVIRIDGKRYRRSLVKIDDAALHQRLLDIVLEKYGGGPSEGADDVWFFHLAPPA